MHTSDTRKIQMLMLSPQPRVEFLEYLRINECVQMFNCCDNLDRVQYFVKYPYCIVMTSDVMHVVRIGADKRIEEVRHYARTRSFTGISHLSITGWMLLLDLANIISMNDYLRKTDPASSTGRLLLGYDGPAPHLYTSDIRIRP